MKVLLSLSGGMDSTALLGYLLNEGHIVEAISFYYGSKHNKYENEAAKNVAEYYGVRLDFIDISTVMEQIKSNLLLTGGDIPEGHYAADNMKLTVVPGRNMIFASILAGIAESRKMKYISMAVHSGDHTIYPDCRPEFISAMSKAIKCSTLSGVEKIYTPFILSNKTDIIITTRKFTNFVPWHLTRTCYKDQPLSCGKCGSCTERLEAFKNNNMKDPIPYEV